MPLPLIVYAGSGRQYVAFYRYGSQSVGSGRQSVASGGSGGLSTAFAEPTKQSMIPSNPPDNAYLADS